MENGQVTQSGKYEELMMMGTTFEQLVSAHEETIGILDSSSQLEHDFERLNQPEKMIRSSSSKEEIVMKPGGMMQLTEEEQKEVGDVGWKSFLDYVLISKGVGFCCLSLLAQSGFVGLQAAASFWLAYSIQNPKNSSVFIVGIYTLISSTSALFVYFRTWFAVLLGLRASQVFFSAFINSIFNAPMLFFDSTPVGRILTRVRN